MIEDFDNIFKDKIGDELPFDFRPNDWLAAEQELDKLMPIAAPVALSPRFLTWHKWAIAATVLLLASQLFLMSQLGKVKQEVVALHQENAELMTLAKVEKNKIETPQSAVIQHDTLIKTVFIEVPSKEKTLGSDANKKEKLRFDLGDFAENNNGINDRNEAVSLNQKSNNKQSLKTNFKDKENELNTTKTGLQTLENSVKNDVKNDVKNAAKNNVKNKDLNGDKNAINANELAENKKENDANLIAITKENLSVINKESNVLNNEFSKALKTAFNALPNTELTAVKSIGRAKNWLNDAAFDFVVTSKPAIIKPISTAPNGWEIAANTLFLTNEEHRGSRDKSERGGDERASFGANLRLIYNLRRAVRLSVDADFWSEKHGKFDPNGPPPANKPRVPSTFDLVGVKQNTRSVQLRFGADYKLRQFIGLQPFIGLGLAYQTRLDDDFQFDFKENNVSVAQISVQNDAKFDKPFSVGLRAGIEGNLYRRLSWSVNIGGQKGGTNKQTWSSHFGLKYAL